MIALGGGDLAGDTVARFAYMDEAGISDDEPIAVVAAVIVHSDRQIKPLENGLTKLFDEYVPAEHRKGFIFHSKKIWYGCHQFPKSQYSDEKRRLLLKAMVHIPADNGMDVVVHWINKEENSEFASQAPQRRERAILFHTMAYIGCAAGIEELMRIKYPSEVLHIVAEDNTESRKRIKEAHALLKKPEFVESIGATERKYLPFHHIVDMPFFAGKEDSSPLQLADACAFSIRRYLEKRPDAEEYYAPLIPALSHMQRVSPV